MNLKILGMLILFTIAQIVSWYQSNSLLLNDWLKDNFIYVCLVLAPITGILFAYGTKVGYEAIGTLWSVRFSAFAVGYLTFIVLTWYHLGEDPFTWKNIVTSLLCFAILAVQAFWK